jgi:threonylcarbamoyladenosine tRNA methylthiotransferase MtaB
MPDTRKKVAFHTLGCKLNFAETSEIARSLPADRFERVTADEKADVYIINTCSVTDAADRKCRQAVKKFIHRSPGAFIAVVGCYAQLKPQDISLIEGVDLVLGSNEKFDLALYLKEAEKKKTPEIHSMTLSDKDPFHSSWSMGDRTRSFLKVQDGCDYGCSYCTIPMARGKSRNPSIKLLLEEAEKIADNGIREIVLTGVNIGDFGKTTGETFYDLVRKLSETKGIERIRLSSVEPNLIDNELIEFVSKSNTVLPHFHIPLQSGSNKILGLMRRRYVRELFAEKIQKIRGHIPLAGIGADVIVGFPGEMEEDFDDTASFIDNSGLTYLHVFSYSERPGTVAASLPLKVAPPEKERRSKLLTQLSDMKTNEFCILNKGMEASVLFEHSPVNNMIMGFTGNYIRAELPWDVSLSGQVRRVVLKTISQDGNMSAELIP